MISAYRTFRKERELDFYARWFLWLLLLRPVLDTFYELKNVSAFASPLYWVGVGTPIMVAISILKGYKIDRDKLAGSVFVNIMIAMIVLNIAAVLMSAGVTMSSLEIVLKVSLFPFIYYYVSVYYRQSKYYDVAISAQALSSIFVYGMIIYEQVFGSITARYTTGGIEAASGLFADSVSYGMYLNISLVSWLYLYRRNIGVSKYFIVGVVAITVVGIISIGHLASLACFVLIIIFYFKSMVKQKPLVSMLIMSMLVVIVYLMFAEEFDKQYQPKIEREMEVFSGDRDAAQGFHGRMTRWVDFRDRWQDVSLFGRILGVSLDFDARIWHSAWLLITPHNDYMRIGFLTGIVGLLSYIAWLFRIYMSSRKLEDEYKFISIATISMFVLYSFTTLPTLYPQSVYYGLLVFVFTSSRERVSAKGS